MRIVLATSSKGMSENGRIATEVKNLGHEFVLLDLKNLDYSIIDSELKLNGYEPQSDDIIIVRATFKFLHAIVALMNYYKSKGIRVFDNHLLEHKYSINKLTDFIQLGASGIPMPKTYHVSTFDQYYEVVESLGYPVIIKLTKSGKGKGIFKMDNKQELDAFIAENSQEGMTKEAEKYVIQEFIPYIHDLRVLLIGEHVHVMKRIPGENEFRANFSLGGAVELFDAEESDIELARKALAAVNLDIGGVDVLITEDGKRYILEANHTPGMLGMEEATGENITKEYLEYAIANAK